jgi:phospho-N-acetylmuramoyl-pentapeptide-transferase
MKNAMSEKIIIKHLALTITMLVKLNNIIIFSLIAFFISWVLYPLYIKILRKYHLGKTIREEAVTGEKSTIFSQMHQHKAGTPTMGGGIFLIVMILMIGLSFVLKKFDFVNNTLIARQETYILLFGFFSMGLIGLVDDILNIKGHGKVK